MTQEAMQSSFEKLSKLNNTSIANMVYGSGLPPYKHDEMTQALISRRNNIVQWLVDNNHIEGSFRDVENTYKLRKAETIVEDNPTIDVALEALKKRPLLHVNPKKGYLQREETNDS